jgi:hypothetical protein
MSHEEDELFSGEGISTSSMLRGGKRGQLTLGFPITLVLEQKCKDQEVWRECVLECRGTDKS